MIDIFSYVIGKASGGTSSGYHVNVLPLHNQLYLTIFNAPAKATTTAGTIEIL